MVLDIKLLDQKLSEKFEAIDDIINKLRKNNIDIEEAKNTFKDLNKNLKESDVKNKNLIFEIENKINEYDKKIEFFETSFKSILDNINKDLANLSNYTKDLYASIRDLERKINSGIERIISLEDFQKNALIHLKKLDMDFSELKTQIISIDKKVAALVEEHNKSFFKRLFKKKLVFE